jgi:hypothetical protein
MVIPIHWNILNIVMGESPYSVVLGKQDQAAKNKEDKTDEAKVVQAKLIRLISGATVTLNFLKKPMPRMRPTTVACKKLEVKSLPLN